MKLKKEQTLRPLRLCGEKSCFYRTAQTDGIALIMVLGLLTVMVILAVTFAVSMRTERLAAGNAADNVRARELVQVGLARAMNQLAAELGTNGLYSKNSSGLPVGKAYPSWNVTNSYTNTGFSNASCWGTNIYLAQKSMTNYIPRALWTEATNADNLSSANHWLPVESVTPPAPGLPDQTNLMGRVAYLILNCSGLLDANYAGGGTRGLGTNPMEIAISSMPEFFAPPQSPLLATPLGQGAEQFKAKRANNIRYETLEEFHILNTNTTWPEFNEYPSNLFVYSRALPGYWSTNLNCVATQVNLSGTAAELGDTERMYAIVSNGLMQAGFSTNEAWTLYRNLLDYVDNGFEPSYYTWYVEPVPMINEVVVSYTVFVTDVGGGNKKYDVRFTFTNECWYPFINDAIQNFTLNSSVIFKDNANPGNEVKPDDLGSEDSAPFQPTAGSFPPAPPIMREKTKSFTAPAVASIELIATINLSVKMGVDVVDRLNVPLILTNKMVGIVDGPNVFPLTAAECLDPRFNFDPDNNNQWKKQEGSAGTIGTTNTWTKSFLSSANDSNTEMFVANQPLRSVAELGYLVYSSNAPWQTVKLYGMNRHGVLDVFGLSTNTSDIFMTNTVYRGLVNCNPNVATDATAAVFADMPVDQYPGEASGLSLDMNQARLVAASIFNSGTYYTNLSEAGQNMVFPVGTTELEKESYFRNAFNLFNLRQNMFTIIIEAQAASGGNIPRNPAKQRAVAIVWRDPFTGEMFVRHIKWLGD